MAAIRDRGSDATDLRDAAHEACHALDYEVEEPWTRERIDEAVSEKNGGRRGRAYERELFARAVEQVVCADLGEPCWTVEKAVLTMCLEALNLDRVEYPFELSVRIVRERMTSPEVRAMAGRIEALVRR